MIAYSPAVSSAAIPTEIRFCAESTSARFLAAGRRACYCAFGIGRMGSRVSGSFFGHTMRTVLPGVVCTNT